MSSIAPYLKTVFGFLTPGAVILGSAVTTMSDGGTNITQAEWVTALVACVVTGSLVFSIPNADPKGTHQDESVQPPERGAVDVVTVLVVVVLILAVLFLLGFLR